MSPSLYIISFNPNDDPHFMTQELRLQSLTLSAGPGFKFFHFPVQMWLPATYPSGLISILISLGFLGCLCTLQKFIITAHAGFAKTAGLTVLLPICAFLRAETKYFVHARNSCAWHMVLNNKY